MDKLLYNPNEVAEILSLSRSKVYELIRDGKLEAHCINGCKTKPIKITKISIIAFYKAGLVPEVDWLL
jgi:excisionase family DNA binding protein